MIRTVEQLAAEQHKWQQQIHERLNGIERNFERVSKDVSQSTNHPPGRSSHGQPDPHILSGQGRRVNQPSENYSVPEPSMRKKDEFLVVGTSLLNKLNRQVLQNVTDSNVKVDKAFIIEASHRAVRP